MIGGVLVAIAAGILGYFVIVRQHAFAAHALAHIGFPGATGAVLIGVPVTARPRRVHRRQGRWPSACSASAWPSARSPPARSWPSPPASGCCSTR